MNLETVSDKHIQELEQLTKEILATLKKAKLLDHPITELLRSLEANAEQTRRTRYDAVNPEFQGY